MGKCYRGRNKPNPTRVRQIKERPRRSEIPWDYTYDCSKCQNLQYMKNPAKHLDGDYCVVCMDQDKPFPIHHNYDTYVASCDKYRRIKKK